MPFRRAPSCATGPHWKETTARPSIVTLVLRHGQKQARIRAEYTAETRRESPRTGAMPHDFNATILNEAAHRPWPMPQRPWVMTQTWHDLLFAHWPIAADVLRPKIPAAFHLDLFEGQAWLGIVPFRM